MSNANSASRAGDRRRSWKKTGAGDHPTPASQRLARWSITVIAVALVGVLAWILIDLLLRGRLPATHVVTLITGESNKATVPSILLADEDLAPLADAPTIRLVDCRRLQESQRISDLGQTLRELSIGKRDPLVLYVSAHGVSVDGKAYLLGRDFDANDPGQARYELNKLLAAAGTSGATTKLLVLDVGWLVSDPRLGMVVNEFPRLAAGLVAEFDDPSVWVLLSNSVMQTNGIDYQHDCSIFGRGVAQALSGDADLTANGGNGDDIVSLDELYRFVLRRCQRLSGDLQTPLLLHAGQTPDALKTIPDSLPLVHLQAGWETKRKDQEEQTKARAKEQAGKKKKESSGNKPESSAAPTAAKNATKKDGVAKNDGAKTAEPATTSSGDSPSSGGASPPPDAAGKEKNAAAKATTKNAVSPAAAGGEKTAGDPAGKQGHPRSVSGGRSLLDSLWRSRDELERPSQDAARWLPLEYAPQLWRELNLLLLNFERQYRGGKAFDQGRLATMLRTHADALRDLAEGKYHAPSTGSLVAETTVIDRIATARQQLLADPECVSRYRSASPELNAVGQAVRVYYRLAYHAPDYVRWHARLCASAPRGDQQFAAFTRTLDGLLQQLLSFRTAMDEMQGKPLDLLTGPARVRELRRALEEAEAELGKAVAQAMEASLRRVDMPRDQRRLEDLLATPLLAADQRKRILDKLLASHIRPSKTRPPRWPQTISVDAHLWQNWLMHLKLERKLIGLIDRDSGTTLEQQVSTAGRITGSNSDADEKRWKAYRGIGTEIQQFYANLARRIQPAAAVVGARGEERRQVEWWMRFVDGRDAELVKGDLPPQPHLWIQPPLPPHEISWSGPREIDLRNRKEPKQLFAGTLKIPPGPATSALITPQFQPNVIEIRTADGQHRIEPGKQRLLPLDAGRLAHLDWLVINRLSRFNSVPNEAGRKVFLQVSAGQLTTRIEITCRLPDPDYVQLVVEPVGPGLCAQPLGRGGIELRPFANRATNYRWKLVNGSPKPKQVTVQLVAAPHLPNAGWARGRLLDEYGSPYAQLRRSLLETDAVRLLPGVRIVAATTQPMTLPADGKAHEIAFPKPGGGEDKAASDTEDDQKKKAEEPAPPKPPAAQPIDDGLLCVITDTAHPQQPELVWIEINPLRPDDYLQPAGNYALNDQKINLSVAPMDVNGDGKPDPDQTLPLDVATKPIDVVWDTQGELPEGTGRNDRDKIKSADGRATLYAVVPPQEGGKVRVKLDVDGLRRAFMLDVDIDKENAVKRADVAEVRIQKIEQKGFPRVYVTSKDQPAEPPPPGGKPPEFVLLTGDQPAVFPAGDQPSPLIVSLLVNAPADAFSDANKQNVIKVGLDVEGFQPNRYYSDRQMRASLDQVAPGGLVTVSTVVDDFRIPLDPGGLKNRRFSIYVDFVCQQKPVTPYQIDVILDGEAPQIRSFAARRPQVAAGAPLRLDLQAVDLSGLAQVQLGLVEKRSDPLKPETAQTMEDIKAPEAGDLWTVPISVDTKDVAPGEYWLKAIITDKVRKSSEPNPLPITILPPQPVMPFEKGTILGVVQIGKLKPDRITVEIKESGIPPVKTSDGGQFRFDNVPAGEHTLIASGYVRNQLRKGEVKVKLQSEKDNPKSVVIPLK